MKRAAGLIFVIVMVALGLLSIRGMMPFMPIFGSSMEPVLKAGDIITIEEISPSQVKVGDIIVYNVPSMIQEHYNYPPIVAHRVISINTKAGINFRTKGDNTGEDPFTVRPQDLRGQVSQHYPYLGFPMLFLQSRQGLIFIIVSLSLFAFYLYNDEFSRGRKRAQRGIFAPVIEENRRTSQVVAQMMESTEKRMEGTEQALGKFASAIEVYAEHLKSHTSAIQGLSEASQELKTGAAEQNKVLTRLMQVIEQTALKREEIIPRVEEVAPKIEKIQFPPGCIRSRQKLSKEGEIFRAG